MYNDTLSTSKEQALASLMTVMMTTRSLSLPLEREYFQNVCIMARTAKYRDQKRVSVFKNKLGYM